LISRYKNEVGAYLQMDQGTSTFDYADLVLHFRKNHFGSHLAPSVRKSRKLCDRADHRNSVFCRFARIEIRVHPQTHNEGSIDAKPTGLSALDSCHANHNIQL
jgi:hypothetical protein